MTSVDLNRLSLNFQTGKLCRQFMKEQSLSPTETEALQITRLRKVCIAAYNNHPFYRDRFDKSRINPRGINSLLDIKDLPKLCKDEYREFTQNLVKNNPRKFSNWYKDGTSGSTGMPLAIYRTWTERAYMSAKWMRVLFRNGYHWRERTFSLPSPHRLQNDSIIQKLGILKRYSVPYTATVERMVAEYLKVKPDIIYANKSQLLLMSVYTLEKGILLPKPRLCISAAETMDRASKRLIIEAFHPISFIEVYGAVEFNNLAWQEPGSDAFIFSHNTNLLELEWDTPLTKVSGKCLITDFFIDSFPLIRYELGDQLEIMKPTNKMAFISSIRGRADDWLIFSDGKRVPFHFFYEIMERRPEIRSFRIIQETHSLIRIQATKESGADISFLEQILLHDLHQEIRAEGIEYRFEWLDKIPPDPNGKLRMLISKVQGSTMDAWRHASSSPLR